MPRQKLTVLIPAKNERKNIRLCIESVRPLADEILVADSGSTDGTLDIVRGIGDCRIIQREYVNSADFKNWAIPQASHPWVLIVDADERVTASLIAEVTKILRAPSDLLDAYSCGFQDFFLGHPLKYSGWDTESIRLFRRDRCRYQGRRVHANIDIPSRQVGRLKSKMLHYSFWTYDEFIQKYARYTQWAAQDLWDKGRRASFVSLLIRPMARFLHLYFVRLGMLDGLAGLQVCFLMSFFNTFFKQARLWQMESAVAQPDPERERNEYPTLRSPATATVVSHGLPTAASDSIEQPPYMAQREAS